VREASDENQLLLATLPPSKQQIRLALGIVVVLLVVIAVTAPFANTQLPRVDAFIPALETAIVINDLITCALLFSQFVVVGRTSLLVLAISFLFTALIVIPHILTFPGTADLLGAGASSASWLGIFWRVSLPLAVVVYVLLSNVDSRTSISKRSPTVVIVWSVSATVAIVCALTWIAIAGEPLLPSLMLDSVRVTPGATYILVFGSVVSLNAVALAMLWVRWRSVLDLWLMVMCCAWLMEGAVAAILINSRFSLGWYAGRVYALVAALFVLVVLLSEATTLYAHLARSVLRQRSERNARQIAMDAMAASIAHEVNQPLAANLLNSQAALHFLAQTPPNIDQVKDALEAIAKDSVRGGEVVASLRTMFKKGVHGRVWFDINDLIREVITMVDVDLRTQRVVISTNLREGLQPMLADRGQLQQVFLNLSMNAIEAMGSVTDRGRQLRLKSDSNQEASGVLVTIEDSGIGIDRKDKDRIFEPFFTTKSAGTGIGLTICRSIIESHGGTLQASANKPYGTIFHVALPNGDS
jgi:signal transduction histidine kinase